MKVNIGLGATALFTVAVVAAGYGAEPAAAPACRLGDVPVPTLATKTLAPQQFRALHAAVVPRAGAERWTEISWQPDLGAARQQAARNGKPLLLWIMDGHPLGCT